MYTHILTNNFQSPKLKQPKVMYAAESKLGTITRQDIVLHSPVAARWSSVSTMWTASSRRFRTPAPARAIQRYTPDEERTRAKLGTPYSYY